MHRSAALSLGIKKFASSFQSQVPLTRRESTQLLALLTSSFRQHLNREHPEGLEESGAKVFPPDAPRSSFTTIRNSSRESANHVIDSVLSSPLLKSNIHLHKTPPPKGPPTREAVLRYFESEIQKGTADLRKARACLLRWRRLPSDDPHAEKSQGSITDLILHWLWSSGQDRRLSFLLNANFTETLISNIYYESRDEICWKWLSRLNSMAHMSTDEIFPKQVSTRAVNLLNSMFSASTYKQKSLDRAMCSYWRLCQMYDIDFTPTDLEHLSPYIRHNYYTSTKRMYNLIICGDYSLSEADFEKFHRGLYLLDTKAAFRRANLLLRHPVKPDCDPALQIVKRYLTTGSSTIATGLDDEAAIRLSLRTAEALIEQGRLDDANLILRGIQNRFPQEQVNTAKAKRKERDSLHLLGSLNPG